MDVNEADFDAQVLARSAQVPVVVDFWAPWCGPCKVLGPALEAEVAELGGQVELAKVNIDDNPGLAQTFAIRAIPALKAFKAGKVVAEMEGAQDRAFLRRWLAGLLPSPSAPILARAEELIAKGIIEEVPALLAAIDPRSPEADRIPLLERRLEFARDGANGHSGDRNALDARWAAASRLAASGAWPEALDAFLEIVTRSRAYRSDGARKAMVAIFEILGPDSDLARDMRRRLQIVT